MSTVNIESDNKETMNRPLCFVLMPFGKKYDIHGSLVDFDTVFKDLITPAILEAGFDPLRSDEELTGGIINKHYLEYLILSDYVIADLTTANPNVFYGLGIRHALRPYSTILIFAEGRGYLPIDISSLKVMFYKLTENGYVEDISTSRERLKRLLLEAKSGTIDNPIYDLVEEIKNINHIKRDVIQDRLNYSKYIKKRLADLRIRYDIEAIRALEQELGKIEELESDIVIDLFLSYRAASSWEDMIALVQKMSSSLASSVLVQEQLGLALNRVGKREEAEKVLTSLINKRGISSETYGILGRVYKDQWESALRYGNIYLAPALLKKAIDVYFQGFDANWRDTYLGINTVTLMELSEPPDPRREQIIPVVTYALERKKVKEKSDYWDYATSLELAVLAKDEKRAFTSLGDALASAHESWELGTTARNLRLIREARIKRNEEIPWTRIVEEKLERRIEDIRMKEKF